MADQFKVGEIAILCNHVGATAWRNGQEVEIVGTLLPREVMRTADWQPVVIECYEFRDSDGERAYAPPCMLKKKPPPGTGEQRIRDMFIPKDQKEEMPA
jgi:hypothetical protein